MDKNLYITKELYEQFESLDDYLQTLTKAHLDKNGSEVGNPKPLVIYTELNKPRTMKDEVERILRHSLSRQMARQGHETEAEANDFEVGEDIVPENYDSQFTLMEEEVPHDVEPIQRHSSTPSKEEKAPPIPDSEPPEVPGTSE